MKKVLKVILENRLTNDLRSNKYYLFIHSQQMKNISINLFLIINLTKNVFSFELFGNNNNKLIKYCLYF
jgi:hypothetical protein